MLDEAIEDSGYSRSSCSSVDSRSEDGGANLDDDWSDADSSENTDGYDTVYTSSGSEYSDDSIDENDIPFSPPTEEKLAELEKLNEVLNSDQVGAISTESLEETDQSLSLADHDDTIEVSISASNKASKESSTRRKYIT
ncbi:hypothetical protein [Candidatus Rickettsia colombianensi]|uniref:hypothetical protein n=1 Tax=Candidatus Rickettsia colombianensi TaxID=1090944 RepID=UPI000EF1EBD0|nr:hypothetical protein [Candidatus Rickettsia colombianensi]